MPHYMYFIENADDQRFLLLSTRLQNIDYKIYLNNVFESTCIAVFTFVSCLLFIGCKITFRSSTLFMTP